MDRASGSGVFARDPDALLDLTELELNKDIIKQQQNKAACAVCEKWLKEYDHQEDYSQDDACSKSRMLEICSDYLDNAVYETVEREVDEAEKAAKRRTAWRIEGTLREYPSFAPVNLWFTYPVHEIDRSGVLNDIKPESEKPPYMKNKTETKSLEERKKENKNKRATRLEIAFEGCQRNGRATVAEMAKQMEVVRNTVKNYIDESSDFIRNENGIVTRKIL